MWQCAAMAQSAAGYGLAGMALAGRRRRPPPPPPPPLLLLLLLAGAGGQ
eukprot:SAG22_NODE_18849_length_280_cov_1.458564_1_plen_48_part_01